MNTEKTLNLFPLRLKNRLCFIIWCSFNFKFHAAVTESEWRKSFKVEAISIPESEWWTTRSHGNQRLCFPLSCFCTNETSHLSQSLSSRRGRVNQTLVNLFQDFANQTCCLNALREFPHLVLDWSYLWIINAYRELKTAAGPGVSFWVL